MEAKKLSDKAVYANAQADLSDYLLTEFKEQLTGELKSWLEINRIVKRGAAIEHLKQALALLKAGK